MKTKHGNQMERVFFGKRYSSISPAGIYLYQAKRFSRAVPRAQVREAGEYTAYGLQAAGWNQFPFFDITAVRLLEDRHHRR